MNVLLAVKHHFSAGHRIPGLAGSGAKCANLHGHTFGVQWTFEVPGVDASVFELTAAKARLRGWVDTNLDHGYLIAPCDHTLERFLENNDFKYYIVDPLPTTEAIAQLLLETANGFGDLDPFGAPCVSVIVTEGPSNQAEVRPVVFV